MATFITTTEISFQIESIIKEANSFIILVSPYLSIHDRLKRVIEQRLKASDIDLYIVCRQKDLKEKELQWLNAHREIRVRYNETLHAKCYINEAKALLTSMNLYEYSMVNNVEFGMLIEKKDDTTNYNKTFNECDGLLSSLCSRLFSVREQKFFAQFSIDDALNYQEDQNKDRPKAGS